MEYFEGLRNVKMNGDNKIYVPNFNGNPNDHHVLVEGDYNGRHFVIIRHHLGFPDVYLEIDANDWIAKAPVDEKSKYFSRYDLYEGCVHGGATYYGEAYWNKNDKRTYIGWDYGHAGDFEAFSANLCNMKGRKWMLSELLMSVAQVEAEINLQNDDHWEELYALPTESE